MEFDTQDRKVVELLTKLKGANEGYPSDMFAARRQTFLNNLAGAGLGMGTGTALNQAVKGGSGTTAAPLTAGKLLEIALLVAIVAEAGALAYFYRDKVVDAFRSISSPSQVQEIASPPFATFPFPELEISGIPSSASPTATASEMATSTQVPGVTDDPAVTVNNNDANPLIDSTPNPSGDNGNNGNHYGQTPKPERTRDNNDNQPPEDNPGNGNNDRPSQGGNDKNH